MSELSHLVPNLNEMMEEYVKGEGEVKETQSRTGLEGERAKVRAEIEQPAEEPRKRKRGVEEGEIEQKNERVRNFISDEAYVLMEKGFKDKGFVGERGFNKLISPFIEMLEKRGWKILGERKGPALLHWSKSFMLTWWE